MLREESYDRLNESGQIKSSKPSLGFTVDEHFPLTCTSSLKKCVIVLSLAGLGCKECDGGPKNLFQGKAEKSNQQVLLD